MPSRYRAAAGVPISIQGSNIVTLNLDANASRAWTTDEFTAGRLVAQLGGSHLVNA